MLQTPDPSDVADHVWRMEEREYARCVGSTRSWVCGTVTNVCVEDIVRGASSAGLRVILVADACAATRDADHPGGRRARVAG